MPVRPVPEGYHSVTPYLIAHDAAAAIEFYQRALGAIEILRIPGPDNRVGHAELRIGDSVVMLADEHPEMGVKSPRSLNGSPVHLLLYVDDVDATFALALAAGGVQTRPLTTKWYGDRSGTLLDPFGHQWTIATHVEDLSPEELQRRAAEATPSD